MFSQSKHPIEGDYVETKNDNFIFDVKGLRHPKDRTICFLRFIPNPDGDRERNGKIYKKIYDLQERYVFLQDNSPKYLFYSQNYDLKLQGVQNKDIKKIYTPYEFFKRLKEMKVLSEAQQKSINLCNLLINQGNLSEGSIGITGSQMVNLNKKE
ncbi:MAG: hypothetical protein EU547_01235, partial [Promethearchaeota archaeon]